MRWISFVLMIFLLAACKNKEGKPNVSAVKIDLTLHRFDKDFFSMDTLQMEASLQKLNTEYPAFLPEYFEFFSPVNFIVQQEGKSYGQAVREYFRNIKPLYDTVQKRFPNLDQIRKGLADNLRYVKFYYPGFKTPAVFTTVESLNPENKEEVYGTLYYRDTLVISLQMFLGKDYVGYDPAQYFDYLRRRFEPEYIVPNSIRAIANTLYPDSTADASLIEQMVEKGKQWYLLDHLLPDTPDSLKTFYTGKQLQWCRENEGNIWSTLLYNTPDLYTIDQDKIQNFLGEAPFTQNMESTNSTPGNIGQWLGWQIVKKFAEKNPAMDFRKVLATPAKKIFQEAKYKPK